jgi:hypothetical protein
VLRAPEYNQEGQERSDITLYQVTTLSMGAGRRGKARDNPTVDFFLETKFKK